MALVRSRGLEPPRLAALTPQASASTNSATTARGRATRARLANRKGVNKPRTSRRGRQGPAGGWLAATGSGGAAQGVTGSMSRAQCQGSI